MIRLTLSFTGADWTTTEDYLGPLKIQGIDTGAGMIFFDSPVTVEIVSPSIGTHYDNVAQVAPNIDALPSVEPSSGQLFRDIVNNGIILTGTNFGLPEDAVQQFISSTEIAITRNFSFDIPPDPQVPSPWRPEPGPLKIVAIDDGAGRVPLNTENGGVVVATVLANVMIQPNKDLHIYQSTKQIQVTGSGFDNDIQVFHLGGKVFHLGGDDDGVGAGDVEVDTLSASQMKITLTEGTVWIKDLIVLPGALWMDCEVIVAGFESQTSFLGGGSSLLFRGPIATVFEEPSINASDIEISHTGSRNMVIWGTGFNDMVAQGVDTGAGMVVFDPPFTVATVVPDSEPLLNQVEHH